MDDTRTDTARVLIHGQQVWCHRWRKEEEGEDNDERGEVEKEGGGRKPEGGGAEGKEEGGEWEGRKGEVVVLCVSGL